MGQAEKSISQTHERFAQDKQPRIIQKKLPVINNIKLIKSIAEGKKNGRSRSLYS